MLKVDLHLHSSFSDGTLPPRALARTLKEKRICVASLTDHDTVDGVEVFLAACRKLSIRGVSGVEFSAAHEGVLHILGYAFDPHDETLRAALERNRDSRNLRNVQICEKLRALGCNIALEEAETLAKATGSSSVGRPHIAQVLYAKGCVPNVQAAFDKYLKRGAPAHVFQPFLAAEECLRLLRGAGGLPVLAHPRQTTSLDELPPLLARLKDAGLWGLECWSPGSSPAEVYRSLELAAVFGLYPTAGSDFHGKKHGTSSVGVLVTEDALPWARLCGGL
ncbi:MAG: PHP domain-containing protein [Synergistaceae bacterium]|jgi:predicted metal-dependent phosphoesterase TrpH|nr:PHP domain-containing protein [Synergistaceae bacterium]